MWNLTHLRSVFPVLFVAAIATVVSCDGLATNPKHKSTGGDGDAGSTGGAGGTGGSSTGGAGGGAEPAPVLPTVTDADLQFCVDEINRYRDTLKLRHYTRSSALEDCAKKAADSDSKTHKVHNYAATTTCPGGRTGQNAAYGWQGWTIEDWGSIQEIMKGSLKMMWNEGPDNGDGKDHGHYELMSSTGKAAAVTSVGCGVAVVWEGGKTQVTVVMDFK